MPGKEIATTVGVSPATVSRVLQCLGLSKLSALETAEPPRRYEREQHGEMIHIDIKKLGKFNQVGHRITGDRPRPSHDLTLPFESCSPSPLIAICAKCLRSRRPQIANH